MFTLIHLLGLFFTLLLQAAPNPPAVAFFEYPPETKGMRFEQGGRFFHLALQTELGWIHAIQKGGVQLIQEPLPLPLGEILILTDPKYALTTTEVESVMGLQFSTWSEWDDPKTMSCSKLVGKLLQLIPKPMDFSTNYWKQIEAIYPNIRLPHGRLGISPDEVYRQLTSQPHSFRRLLPCELALIQIKQP